MTQAPIAWLDMAYEPRDDWQGRIVATNPEYIRECIEAGADPKRFVPLVPEPDVSRETWHGVFSTLAKEREQLKADLQKAEEELASYKEALTPSTETKAAYMGEIELSIPHLENVTGRVAMLSWVTTKEVMAMIRKRAER